MAEAIAAAIITAVAGAAAATGATLAITTALVSIGISVGVSMLAQAFLAPGGASAPRPADRQFTLTGSALPRFRSYGRVRVGGAQIFVAAAKGVLYRVTAHNHGRIDAVEEHIIDDAVVTVDGSGDVTDTNYIHSGKKLIHVETRDGAESQTHYATLTAAVPEWDADHRGDGVAHSLVSMASVPADVVRDYYPNYERTSYKQTIRASLVWDPRDVAQDPADEATWAWSDNQALVVLDYLRHRTGFGMPIEWIMPEIEAWKAAADVCDDAVALAAGGTEPRYRIWGSYNFDERPGDVLARFLTAGGARLWIGPNGGVQVSPGAWTEPDVVIDDDAIVAMTLSSGSERPDAANTVTATYTDPALGYRETDAAPWVLQDLVTRFGEIRADARLYECPSHGQARRIMKQAAAKLAPRWKGTLQTNLRALPALSDRFVRLTSSDFDLDITIEIDGIEFDMAEGGIVRGLVIEWTSIDAETFAWDAETEEGEASEPPPPISRDGLSPPENFDVAMRAAGSTDVHATWDELVVDTLAVEIAVRRLDYGGGVPGDGVLVGRYISDAGATSIDIVGLLDGVAYEFVATTVASSSRSDSTDAIEMLVASDTIAPGVPTSLSATATGSDVDIDWTQPSSTNTSAARVYRNTADAAGAATLIATVMGGASASLTHTDAGLAAGAYWYWIAAVNGSGVESARTPAGAVTIT